MAILDWKEKKYSEVYDSCLASLVRQREADPSITPEDIRGILTHLYIQDGNDWTGRGEVQDIQLQACIDAHEFFLAEWESKNES